jgi:uncharacterized protein YbbK (DUF523 family)
VPFKIITGKTLEKILVSACLLSVACRYDSGTLDKKSCTERIRRLSGRYLPVPACPEQLGGLPTPRAKMSFSKLPADEKSSGSGRVVDINGVDRTLSLQAGAAECVKLAKALGIGKALLKERSPSCGVRQVYLGESLVEGEGVAARALRLAGVEVVSEEEQESLF